MAPRQLRCGLGLCLAVVMNGFAGCGGGGGAGDGGAPSACPSPIECYPSYQATLCPQVVLKTITFAFDPNDARWTADYQACLAGSGGLVRPTECDWFCDDIVATNPTLAASTGFGKASVDCPRAARPTITVEYSTVHCDPVPPADAGS